MSYRNDAEAAHARIDALEQELAETRRHLEIAKKTLAVATERNALALQK